MDLAYQRAVDEILYLELYINELVKERDRLYDEEDADDDDPEVVQLTNAIEFKNIELDDLRENLRRRFGRRSL